MVAARKFPQMPRGVGRATDVCGLPWVSMLVSYVLRLHPDRLGHDEFVGEIEAVASGRKIGVNCLSELRTFVEETIDGESEVIRDSRVEWDGV